MELLSKEELYFTYWLQELEEAGYINSWGQCITYQLGEKIINKYQEQKVLKKSTKIIDKEQIILNGCEYTPDFQIHWNIDAINIFFDIFPTLISIKVNTDLILAKVYENDNVKTFMSVVEVKNNYDAHNMTRLNGINRKWMYEKHGIFVNLVKVPDIFKDTFVPKAYLLTDSGKQQRLIHFPVITLEEYVERKNKATS